MEKKKLIGSGQCPFCGKDNRVEATDKELEGYDKWKNGEMHIQYAMPLLAPEKREVLISGICVACQEETFGVSHEEVSTENDELINSKEYTFTEYTFTPEPIEYELNKLGYTLGEEENSVVEFKNGKTGMILRLDYNIMAACKVHEDNIFDNGNLEEIDSMEERILEKYGFSTEDDEPFDEGLYDEDYLDDDLPF